MTGLNASIRDIPRPVGVDQLPIDGRGFPVPWFVDWPNGVPDHRLVDGRRFVRAVREQRCWVCGGKLGRVKASVVGPMCAVNRITSEPPSHPQCAGYAVRACPFLSQPRARRNYTKPKPVESQEPAGVMIDRNPGVSVIWLSLYGSKPFRPERGTSGTLFDLGPPHRVTWWREGRPATYEEAMESLSTGLPALLKVAEEEGPRAVADLAEATGNALKLLPVSKAYAASAERNGTETDSERT